MVREEIGQLIFEVVIVAVKLVCHVHLVFSIFHFLGFKEGENKWKIIGVDAPGVIFLLLCMELINET